MLPVFGCLRHPPPPASATLFLPATPTLTIRRARARNAIGIRRTSLRGSDPIARRKRPSLMFHPALCAGIYSATNRRQ
jgi:hypothetical protein